MHKDRDAGPDGRTRRYLVHFDDGGIRLRTEPLDVGSELTAGTDRDRVVRVEQRPQ